MKITMSEKNKTRVIWLIFLISLLIACMAVIYGSRHFGTDTRTVQWGEVQQLKTGWQYSTDNGRKDIPCLPAKINADNANSSANGLTLYNRLPDSLPGNPVLEFVSNWTTVEIFIDNRVIYEYGLKNNAPVGQMLGSPWNVVDLPDDAAGKEVAIRLTSPYIGESYNVPVISLGSKSDVLYKFLYSNLNIVIFCLVACIFGLMILLLSAFFKIKKIDIDFLALVFLALHLFLAVIWIITDSRVLLLVTHNYAFIYILSHISFMLMPVPLILFLRQTAMYGKSVYGILSLGYMLNFIVLTACYFLGIAEYEKTLFITHILMGISLIVCLALLIKEQRLYHKKATMLLLAGSVVLTAGLLVSLFVFLFISQEDNSAYFRIILFLLMGAVFCSSGSRIVTVFKKEIESQIYHKMAYTDAMTNLENRLAFQERIQDLQEKPDCLELTIIMFDINKLKYVNDNYGHNAGDKLINAAGDCIYTCFKSHGECYRIGGDEFIVLLKDCSEESLKFLLRNFQISVSAAETVNPEGLDVAVGYATGSTKDENFAYHLFEIADRNMYRQKADSGR